MALDVLQHDDGVVDDEANRDAEPHQRQVVEAEAATYISANVPTSASGTVTLGMIVAGEAAQEQENHHHDKRDGKDQRELHVARRTRGSSWSGR